MTVTLRYENSTWPLIRVLYATTFGATGAGPWTIAPYVAPGVNGLTLDECTRQCLPAIGEALLKMEYGTIDGSAVTPLDLLGKHIRIQMAPRRTDGETPAWRTVWLGVCAWQDDTISPAADYIRGTRLYRCYDLLYHYANGYPLDRHADYGCPSELACGHPGYNYDRGNRGVVTGNMEASGSVFTGPDNDQIRNFGVEDSVSDKHVDAWSDQGSVRNALSIKRAAGDPIFDIDCKPTSLLSGKSVWRVDGSDTAWTFINTVLSRKRGKGLAFFDWEDDAATPTGAIAVRIRVRPQLANAITYTDPVTGAETTINGASAITYTDPESGQDVTTHDQVITVDVQGDHRAVDGSMRIRDRGDSTFDQLTTEGEQIEVAATGSIYDGTFVARWASELESAWSAASADVKAEVRFYPVLQRFGIKRGSLPSWLDGDNGATGASYTGRVDYWTTATGALSNTHTAVTAPNDIEVMDDMPLYEGYDYSGATPVPAAGAAADGRPSRRRLAIYMRTASNRYQTPEEWNSGGCAVYNDYDGTTVEWSGDEEGTRALDADDMHQYLTFTVGLRMPQRVRLQSSISGTVRTKRTIRMRNLHFWMGHPGCIWDLNGASADADGSPAKRIGGTIGSGETAINGKILRDDRSALARAHYLAWEWYRSDSTRCSVVWSLRACGLLPSYTDVTGTPKTYPTMGKIIGTMYAGGQTLNPITPVTRISYDNTTGTTTWHTDWEELDRGTA